MDASFRKALLTTARHLDEDRVVMFVTSRPQIDLGGWNRFILDPERCKRLTLGALSPSEVSDLAALGDLLDAAGPPNVSIDTRTVILST